MIKTVYFDLGNVLIFFSISQMLSQISHCTGLSTEQVQQIIFKTELRERYEKGLVNTAHLYETFRDQTPKAFTQKQLIAAFSEIFTPNTEVWKVVEQLKKANVRLILLSNTSESHFDYAYANYPVLKLFDHHVLSYKMGVWKPDPQIFHKALEHAQCAPNECFYTDDIPEFIESARQVGLPGEVFTTVPELKKHLRSRGYPL